MLRFTMFLLAWMIENECNDSVICIFVKAKQMSERKKFCCQTMTHTTLCHFGSSDGGVGH